MVDEALDAVVTQLVHSPDVLVVEVLHVDAMEEPENGHRVDVQPLEQDAHGFDLATREGVDQFHDGQV